MIHIRKWTWSAAVAGTANRSTHISAERWTRSWTTSARWNGSNSSTRSSWYTDSHSAKNALTTDSSPGKAGPDSLSAMPKLSQSYSSMISG